MVKNNYKKLSAFSLFYYAYMYVDSKDNMADRLFINHKVTVKFGPELTKGRYKMVLCKIKKRDEKNFLAALAEMYDKALLMGYTDYRDACSEIGKTM